MARSRRGSFGLQPRVAPNVSAQIIALAREYEAKRDALIMDAWRSGGTFEGKKATDDMVLAYWRERQKGLDSGDPNYEEAKNNVMQLQYGIEQSKADLLHVQGKMSDNAYAQFYMRWANKVPKNSEFYRVLQKDAAQLIESAKANARANSERARTEAFNAFVSNTTSRDIAIGDAMTAALSDLSKSTGLSITGNGDELLAKLTEDVRNNPNEYRALLDTIKKGDPGWDGQLTEGYFNQHIKAATQGYSLIADRAQKGGYVSAYASATQGMSAMSSWGQNLKVWPVAESYSVAENAFSKVWNDPNASQMDQKDAAEQFSAKLSSLAATPGIDAGAKSMLVADSKRLLGQDAGDSPSFGTSMLQRPGIGPEMTMQLGAWAQTAAEMAANPLAWSYAPVDKNGQFDVTGNGPLGIVPAGSIQPGAQAVMVPGANGKSVLAMVMPHAVYSTDPNNPSASPTLVGYQISYNVGGKSVQMWGYKDNKGASHWSLVSPLVDGATVKTNDKGDIYVSPPASAAPDISAQIEKYVNNGNILTPEQKASLISGGSIDSKTDTSSKGKAGVRTVVTVSVKNGYLTSSMKQTQIDALGKDNGSTTTLSQMPSQVDAMAFSSSRLAAGEVAGVTFASPLQVSVRAASYTQTQDQVRRFASDPAFQQAFLSQTMQTLGITNPYDPRIASAWKDVTTASERVRGGSWGGMTAAERKDLNYPGQKNDSAYAGSLTINFGKSGELRLPGLPSYLHNQNVDPSTLGGAVKMSQAILGNILPGLGAPSQTPAGSPAPSATPMPTPTLTTITPTPTPIPTDIPKPMAVPTPTPVSAPSSRYSGKVVPI